MSIKASWIAFKRRWFPQVFALTAKMLIRTILATCKVQIHGIERFLSTARSGPCLIVLWHCKLVIISEILNKNTSDLVYTAFISKSRDGDPLAALAESYQIGRALRVAHNGRHLALGQMIHDLKHQKSIYIVTPDGPRGPRLEAKPGTAVAAREANASIVPFSWKANRWWELNTWDKMQIPKPFATIDVFFGKPVDLSKSDQENDVLILEQLLKSAETVH